MAMLMMFKLCFVDHLQALAMSLRLPELKRNTKNLSPRLVISNYSDDQLMVLWIQQGCFHLPADLLNVCH